MQQDIDGHIDRHSGLKNDLALLQSIPAVGPQVGSNMLAVMHSHDFGSAEQVAAYLGLVPVERQSGSSVLGRAKLSKAGLTCQNTRRAVHGCYRGDTMSKLSMTA